MSIPLERLMSCFQGLVPGSLYTCSGDGVPNVAHVSHVEYVDPSHVALSYQFFNKSRRNVAENPRALVRVVDPETAQCYELRLRYVRSETAGPVFDGMALRVDAVASHSGLKGVFRLLAADVYEVVSVGRAIDETGIEPPAPRRAPAGGDGVFTLHALGRIAQRIHQAPTLDVLLDAILETLDEVFGFTHAMILLAGDEPGRLVTIASRGYDESGVGAEVRVGEGLIGMVAEARKPIRVAGLVRDLLYAYAVREREQAEGRPTDRFITLPGLHNPESQLGIPLLVRNELLGVLCVESEQPYRFQDADRTYLELLGSYLAIAIQNILLQARAEDVAESASPPAATDHGSGASSEAEGAAEGTEGVQAVAERAAPSGARGSHEVTFYRTDECILVDGEYLVRSLPARLLWKILAAHAAERRVEFTNRELRLDKTLNLPEVKDNLECRLLLLRRRLEQRCPDIALEPSGRGRFTLRLGRHVVLRERP